MEMHEFNQQVIAEFRANEGRVGGMFEGAPMVLLHHVGRKSGVERVAPLMYRSDHGRVVVFGSKGGAEDHADWYRNLVANPDVTIEVGTETREVRARVAEGDERERLWSAQKTEVPQFADYEVSAGDRVIPVVVLEPR